MELDIKLLTILIFVSSPLFLNAKSLLYEKELVMYAKVDKARSYHRKMYYDKTSIKNWDGKNSFPENSLIVMETWYGSGQGPVYYKKMRNGQWVYGSFSPGSPRYRNDSDLSCVSCHVKALSYNETFTKELVLHHFKSGKTTFLDAGEKGPIDASPLEFYSPKK